MTNDGSNHDHDAAAANFATTHWSIVVAAGGHDSASRKSLADLCNTYWYPLYAYVRRKGHQIADAQDLTQAFFAELLDKERLQLADQQRGRFRSFLLAALNNFLHNQWRDAAAEKRGGGQSLIRLDFEAGETRYDLEPADVLTPEKIFERRWAMTLLEKSVARLRAEYETSGKLPLFDRLKAYLGGDSDSLPYREIADELAMTEGAIKVAIHRLRRRCRELLRDEIAQTVASPDEIDDELRQMFAALGV